MAITLWGNVYLYGRFAGILSEEPGKVYKFTYDKSFIDDPIHEISQTLPIRKEPHYSIGVLHPYFDNLIAEGWLANAQAKALGTHIEDRLRLLLAFGHDCIGAVTVRDPEESQVKILYHDDKEKLSALASRASISGVQPKIFLLEDQVAGYGERSTHIGKLDLGMVPNLVDIEYLSMKIASFLLPSEDFAEVQILSVLYNVRALIVKRFDRPFIHFEEFNQLLSKNSRDKYDAPYHLMAKYINSNSKCAIFDIERLFHRILVNLIIGNTDAHLKNFGMIYKNGSLELAPSYDVVSTSYYPEYQNIALAVGVTENLHIKDLKYKHLKLMTSHFGLNIKVLHFALEAVDSRFERSITKLQKDLAVPEELRAKFIDYLRKKWNNIKNSLGKS